MSIFISNIEATTMENPFYRRVLYTAPHQQLVVMSIHPEDDVPLEVHPTHDQFVRIESGTGKVAIGPHEEEVYPIKDGVAFIIPAGTYHRIINTSRRKPLKLYTIYSPPEHAPNTIERVKHRR